MNLNSLRKNGMPIYLDYQATTKPDPRVIKAMMPYFENYFGNAHSRSHSYGWQAEEATTIAREQIADLINANPKEIIYTSGATESNNLAIRGVLDFYGKEKNHIITVQTEHKCLLDTCRQMQHKGLAEVTYLPVEKNGLIDVNKLKDAIKSNTILVSVMAVNNEIGVIQPLKEIGEICRENGIFFHSDIAQAFGKIPINVEQLNLDLASISGHKIYGPMGIGALYVRKKPRIRLSPIIYGGGQERGIRSGTLPMPLAVGLGKAAEIAKSEMQEEYSKLKQMYEYFLNKITSNIDAVYLNGDKEKRFPGNINLSFAFVEGESIILGIKDLAVSSGSACTSASLEPSYILKALGVSEELAHTSIRFGIGRYTTQEELEFATNLIISKIQKLRDMSPLWEMHKEGVDISKINWQLH